jgi:hypothetical protein
MLFDEINILDFSTQTTISGIGTVHEVKIVEFETLLNGLEPVSHIIRRVMADFLQQYRIYTPQQILNLVTNLELEIRNFITDLYTPIDEFLSTTTTFDTTTTEEFDTTTTEDYDTTTTEDFDTTTTTEDYDTTTTEDFDTTTTTEDYDTTTTEDFDTTTTTW